MRALICINTCDRALNIKALIWEYIEFCKTRKDFDFIISLDGKDEKTIQYCKKHSIPLLYSDEKEGVGLSKNRVLKEFPEYDYYFFIEDDTELLNPDVFDIHIDMSKKLNIHHFSLFDRSRIRNIIKKEKVDDKTIIYAKYGSAQFNFFTKEGIKKVGGFHTEFAKYKRFGHTEHTYRFVNAGLSKYPFVIIEDLLEGYLRWNDPISVTKLKVKSTSNRLFIEEEKLIEKKLKFYPLQTISDYYVINKEKMDCEKIEVDKFKKLYKLQFYAGMNALNLLRSVKRLLKNAISK